MDKIVAITLSCLYTSLSVAMANNVVALTSTTPSKSTSNKDEEVDNYSTTVIQRSVSVFTMINLLPCMFLRSGVEVQSHSVKKSNFSWQWQICYVKYLYFKVLQIIWKLSNCTLYLLMLFYVCFQLEIFNTVSAAMRNSTRAGGNVSVVHGCYVDADCSLIYRQQIVVKHENFLNLMNALNPSFVLLCL